jgi:hypothetical protein
MRRSWRLRAKEVEVRGSDIEGYGVRALLIQC